MRRLSVVLGLLALVLLTGGPAFAEQPLDVPEQVYDEAGVLVGNESAVEDAVAELQADEDIQLWVVYVDTFDGIDPPTWAAETADRSDFGGNDMLFAVGVEDHRYGYSIGEGFPRSDAEVEDLLASRSEEH